MKPGFFKNAELTELPPLARILFSGLWGLADRRGRLEDRPKQIKGEVLPHDRVDIDTLLSKLADRGFILRYVRNKNSYIQIINFNKHQHPHIKESESTIPAPDKHHAGPVRKRLVSDSPFPLPDSPLLVTAADAAKPYPLPDPKVNPTACLVISYKIKKAVPYDSREWDALNWGRCAAAAKVLLSLCRDLETAESCLAEVAKDFDAKNITWTLETIAKHAPDWLKKNGRTDANASRSRLRLAIAEQRSKNENSKDLEKPTSGQILASIRDDAPNESGS